MSIRRISFQDETEVKDVFGVYDANIKAVEKALSVQMVLRGLELEIRGEEEQSLEKAEHAVKALRQIRAQGNAVNENTVSQALDLAQDDTVGETIEAMQDVILLNHKGQPVKCRTIGQKKYIQALRDNTVTICIGPAGTGKTYLAVAMALKALKEKQIDRIIVSRPAIEAGEKLGFLPGDLQQKVDPYLRPLYDAFHSLVGPEKTQQYLEKGIIEIAPIAYMRGRTLDNAFVTVDESQNVDLPILKMILTRLGENSKIILTGDVTQIDLPNEKKSGLAECAQLLKGIEGIEIVHLTNRDVVRHRLVKEIVKAFEKHESQQKPSGRNVQKPQNRKSK